MSLWKIAWRSMQRRALASTLTSISMALGVTLVIAVLVVQGVVQRYFMQGAQGYHLIVGAKGGKLQLVFNTVYHLSQPIENIPWSYYKEFTSGKFASSTKMAIPFCLGDSFEAGGERFRAVGTTPEMFEKLVYSNDHNGNPLYYQFKPGGRNFKAENYFEAVIGSVVAHASGLKVGDKLKPTHGISGEGDVHDAFEIVGILEPTGTPNDRAVFVNIEGFYLLEGHAKAPPEGAVAENSTSETLAGDPHHAQPAPLPENQREVTAILVLLKNNLISQSIFTMVNEGRIAQAVYPSREITKFFSTFVMPVEMLLLILTGLIVLVAGLGIMVSIYNSMSDRAHEIAVMRALGAGRATVMAVILLESTLLSLLGGGLGIVLGHGLMALLSPPLVARTGVSLHPLQFNVLELAIVPALVVLASIVGSVPAMAAYRTDVAKALSSSP